MIKDKKRRILYVCMLAGVVLVIIAAIWGPERLAGYQDRYILNHIVEKTVEEGGEGYRYSMNSFDRLFLLSKCLGNQILPESDQSALTRPGNTEVEYDRFRGAYAFVVNHSDSSEKEITREQIWDKCNDALKELQATEILPDSVKPVSGTSYSAELYSAIDVLEPRNNVAVWKVELSTIKQNADKRNRLLDAYIDADTGKIYQFYVRIDTSSWEEIDADVIMEKWSSYMGLEKPERCESLNPLEETTPYFRKYVFKGEEEGNVVVTVGFYEGINELFLKIS